MSIPVADQEKFANAIAAVLTLIKTGMKDGMGLNIRFDPDQELVSRALLGLVATVTGHPCHLDDVHYITTVESDGISRLRRK
jgi:hypothetical protein